MCLAIMPAMMMPAMIMCLAMMPAMIEAIVMVIFRFILPFMEVRWRLHVMEVLFMVCDGGAVHASSMLSVMLVVLSKVQDAVWGCILYMHT